MSIGSATIDALWDLGVREYEKATDHDGHRYLSIPVGYRQAIEVEEETTTTTRLNGRATTTTTTVYVWFRRWDQTNGLAEEIELASIHQVAPRLIARIVKACVDEHEEQQRSIVSDEDEHFEGPYDDGPPTMAQVAESRRIADEQEEPEPVHPSDPDPKRPGFTMDGSHYVPRTTFPYGE